jgi:hypothetical protein
VRAEEWIVPGLEQDRDVAARIGAPDDEIAASRVGARYVLEVAEQRPGPTLAAVVESVRIGCAREEVTDCYEAGAVGRERQRAAERDRTELAVMDLGLVGDAPACRSDDLLPDGRH